MIVAPTARVSAFGHMLFALLERFFLSICVVNTFVRALVVAKYYRANRDRRILPERVWPLPFEILLQSVTKSGEHPQARDVLSID